MTDDPMFIDPAPERFVFRHGEFTLLSTGERWTRRAFELEFGRAAAAQIVSERPPIAAGRRFSTERSAR